MRLRFLLSLLLLPYFTLAQARLNLNFEPAANRHQPLLLWTTRLSEKDNPFEVLHLDTLTRAASGRGSLLVDLSRAEEPVGGAIYTSIAPLDSMKGQTITISGRLRTQRFTGKAYLYAHAQTATVGENLASNDNFNTPALPATAEWQRVQIQLPVPMAATSLLLGLRFQGQGRVWLDDVQVEWNNGQRCHDPLLPGTEPLLLSARARQANWDFERPWPTLPDPRYHSRRDSVSSAHHGRYSLLLEPADNMRFPYAYVGQVPLDSSKRGKTLVVQGYLRRSGTTPLPTLYYTFLAESTRLGIRRGARSQVQEVALPLASELTTSSQWHPFRVEVPMVWNSYYTQLAIGLHLSGPGPVWVDDLQLLVDGKPYAPPADPAAVALPTTAELTWLRQAAVPLRTTAPDGGDTKDLVALGTLIGKAQIVGLGEVTHGSREIAQLRHRLSRYLVDQKGARTLALEADVTACLALNDYLQTGQGNPWQLVQALGSYNSTETLLFVQWLRAYNERATTKVQLWGMECLRPDAATTWLRNQLPERATTLRAQLDQLGKQLLALPAAGIRLNPFTEPRKTDPRLTATQQALQEVRGALEERNRLTGGLTLPETATQRQLLRMLEQYISLQTLDLELISTYRANCLAESLQWVHSQPNGGRLVVLAHNNVLAATGGTGQQLRITYGLEYVTLGLAFGKGTFRADEGVGGPFSVARAALAEPGSYEYYFQAARLPLSYLDLRSPDLMVGTQWLYQNLLLRDVGHTAPPTSFLRHDLRREFDAVVFIPVSSPLQAVP